MNRKKLLVVVASLLQGGQERAAVNTANIMSEMYDVYFVVLFDGFLAFKPNCEVISLGLDSGKGVLGRAFVALKRAVMLKKLKKKLGIDYSIAFGPEANLANVLSGKRSKNFAGIRGYGSLNTSAFSRKYSYKNSDGVICCAKAITDRLCEMMPKKKDSIYTLYNAYNFEKIISESNEAVEDVSFDVPTVVSCGRLEKIKNFPRLIRAFSLVKKKHPNLQLLLIGDGKEYDNLSKLAHELGIEDSVIMPRYRKNPYSYIKRSSVYALSSYNEGFPNSLVEGMMFLPVVSVDCKSGPREILAPGMNEGETDGVVEAKYGVLVPDATAEYSLSTEISPDDEFLAEGISVILDSAEKTEYYRNQAAERARDFSEDTYRKKLMDIIENA